MKAGIASVVTALIVAGGAGAYVAAVTPQQFNALKAQVANLKTEIAAAKSEAQTAESDAQGAASEAQGANTYATHIASTVYCIQGEWNGLQSGQWTILGNYGGTTALLVITTANFHTCS